MDLEKLSNCSKSRGVWLPNCRRRKLTSAALNSSVKRNDVFVSKELVKEHLTSPLNDNSIFFVFNEKEEV